MSSKVCSWHFCDVRGCPLYGRFRGQSGPQPAAGSRLRAHGQNSSGQDDPNRREPRVLARRRPDAARCGPVRGPAPTPYSHTPPRAVARRHAALPMTLVDAHRAARRDSPVLPVRIFPSVSRDPIRGERPSSADATETPCRVRTGLSLTAANQLTMSRKRRCTRLGHGHRYDLGLLPSQSKLAHSADGRPAQVVEVTLRRLFVPSSCATVAVTAFGADRACDLGGHQHQLQVSVLVGCSWPPSL